MSISVITPHYNDFEGIKQTHNCLVKQNTDQWEWVIVDDCSDPFTKESLKEYFKQHNSSNIKLVFNDKKTTGSVCRNIGVDHANYNHLVFLDSDDIISEDFVSNRNVEVEDFVVFRNTNILDEKGNNKPSPTASSNYLDHFLQAKFIWPITSVLWNKEYLIKIGKFNSDLKRLQDIELSIRALILSENYKVIDNKVDFFYCVSPIDIKKRPIDVICGAVDYLINYMHDNFKLDKRQRDLVTGYYFLCVRYFNRSENKTDIVHVQHSLKLFYKKKYMSYFSYLRALTFLKLYKSNIISSDLFIRLNRYFYK
ncbi:glycosyltransferase [Candidatus Marifrigoribacter sp. Uisw_064]|jgi:glycosyltransferase involved in cell wall biosynthesis|uniref:glycosyltransferase family 2 protein n=1 Tax=Candidatus Marifrigoribacter sp. Uisw_064 TaxID=3230970 RepID=UPI003ADD8ACD